MKDRVTAIGARRKPDTGDRCGKPIPASGSFKFIWATGPASRLKALVGLCRVDGSLLVRRGIGAPGRDPAGAP